MLLDADLLLYAIDSSSRFHDRSAAWLENPSTVMLPSRFRGRRSVRSSIPPASERTARVYASLNEQIPITGRLVPDAQLAALAIEHGLEVLSADGDFARFPGLRWRNPIAPA